MPRKYLLPLCAAMVACGVCHAVDFAPLDGKRLFTLDFSQALAADRPDGAAPVAIKGDPVVDAQGFHGPTLNLGDGGQVSYGIPIGPDTGDWTFWFWCNTDRIAPGEPLARIGNGRNALTVILDEGKRPALVMACDGSETGRVSSGRYLGGEDWLMYAIRRTAGPDSAQVVFLINGAECGHLAESAGFFAAESSTLAIGPGTDSTASADGRSRYDNVYLYAADIPSDALATHYADETRIAREMPYLTDLRDDTAPEEYIYSLRAGSSENVLKNGSFELGLKGWRASPNGAFRPTVDAASPAAHGAAALRFEGEAKHLDSYLIHMPEPGEFHLRFSARGQGQDASLIARVHDGSSEKRVERKFPLNSAFSAHTLSGSMGEPGAVYVSFDVEMSDNGLVWLDAVSLSAASVEGFTPSPSAFFIATGRPYDAFLDDEPVALILSRDPASSVELGLSLALDVFDIREARVATVDCTQALSQSPEAAVPLRDLPSYGAFRAVLRYGGAVVSERVLSRIPRPLVDGVDHASRYGGHFPSYPENLGFARVIGSHWNRNHDAGPYAARWKEGDRPSTGAFQYRFDILDLNSQHGQELIATMTAPHDDVAAFGDDIAALVRGYQGKLKYLEIFNEPTATIPADHYADLQTTAYARAKKVDPDIRVLGLSTWDVVHDFTKTVIGKAGVDSMDVFSAHFYNWGPTAWLIPDGNWGQGHRLRMLRTYLDEQGGQDLPIWHTESGVYIETFYRHHPHRYIDNRYVRHSAYRHHSAYEGAIWIAQAFPVNFANSAQVYTYYFCPLSGGPVRFSGHSLAGTEHGLKPAAVAYAVSAHHLDRSTFVAALGSGIFGTRAYEFSRDGVSTVVAWHQGCEPVYFADDRLDYVDMMGCERADTVDSASSSRRAYVNTSTGTPHHVDIAPDEHRLFLDLEPRYFPGMTLDAFRGLLAEPPE